MKAKMLWEAHDLPVQALLSLERSSSSLRFALGGNRDPETHN
jgi:hypothetical protein